LSTISIGQPSISNNESRIPGTSQTSTCSSGHPAKVREREPRGQEYAVEVPTDPSLGPFLITFDHLAPLLIENAAETRCTPACGAFVLVAHGDTLLGAFSRLEAPALVTFSPVYPIYSIEEVVRLFNPKVYFHVQTRVGC
jgi:hypothetical protein